MNIVLKAGNRPTEPGWYVYRHDRRTNLVRVVAGRDGMEVCHGHNHFTTVLSMSAKALWSDQLELVEAA